MSLKHYYNFLERYYHIKFKTFRSDNSLFNLYHADSSFEQHCMRYEGNIINLLKFQLVKGFYETI